MSLSDQQLIDAATRVREQAYAPYSRYLVGSALVDELGRLHVGCNVENSSFPLGACAEASAISAMVAAGGKQIAVIAPAAAAGNASTNLPTTRPASCCSMIRARLSATRWRNYCPPHFVSRTKTDIDPCVAPAS